MIPTSKTRRFEPGTLVRVIQHVRVGKTSWTTEIVGRVVSEGLRPIGGMEMGTKAAASSQPTLTLRGEDGELSTVAIDERTEIQLLSESRPSEPLAVNEAQEATRVATIPS
ncbi:hypothetical protein Isop_0808 [Isosphaera pallida ATCC 43644]|uniref:Uncharacterized protein n=1 Tax=Isosphaera pallida (strain ATCC 43644 / DSM 9630 / IS1B) TaxID=575540 RepID=E8R2B4_ISOPI|nr:hypothetical protein [Isosphaera pallida]ADV61399.1 hypothetical protein Isop_0808 [Isosphaera pallida ATCC 43644]